MDGYKEIIITREKSMWGCAVDFTVLLDGKVVGTLRNGDTISVYTQDGPHTLLFQKGKKIDCSVSILISPEDKVWVVNTEISGSHLAVDSQYASNTTEATAFDLENSPRKQAKRSNHILRQHSRLPIQQKAPSRKKSPSQPPACGRRTRRMQ